MKKSFDDYFTAIVRQDKPALQSLLAGGIPEDAVDTDKRTPLMHAIAHHSDNLQLIREILKSTPDVNAQDFEGLTALHFATRRVAVEVVALLLEHDVDVDLPDKHGNTPLLATAFNKPASKELVRLLIHAGANKMARNNYDVTPESLVMSMTNCSLEEFLSS